MAGRDCYEFGKFLLKAAVCAGVQARFEWKAGSANAPDFKRRGIGPRLRGAGTELFYVSGDQKTILSVDIATKPDFQFSATKLSVPAPLGVNANVPVFPGCNPRRAALPGLRAGRPEQRDTAVHRGFELAGAAQE